MHRKAILFFKKSSWKKGVKRIFRNYATSLIEIGLGIPALYFKLDFNAKYRLVALIVKQTAVKGVQESTFLLSG